MPLASNLAEVLKTIPQQPQRQDSQTAQLADLRDFAVRLGLYDAADYIRLVVERAGRPLVGGQ